MVLVVLFKVPDISVALVALTPPVKPPVTEGAAQVYSVPAGTIPLVLFIGVIVKEAPLQVVVVIALMAAKGLTVTLTVKALPLQLPDRVVTV